MPKTLLKFCVEAKLKNDNERYLQEVEAGLHDLDSGSVVSHEEVKKHIAKLIEEYSKQKRIT
jgi:predicted transcriptional regulator